MSQYLSHLLDICRLLQQICKVLVLRYTPFCLAAVMWCNTADHFIMSQCLCSNKLQPIKITFLYVNSLKLDHLNETLWIYTSLEVIHLGFWRHEKASILLFSVVLKICHVTSIKPDTSWCLTHVRFYMLVELLSPNGLVYFSPIFLRWKGEGEGGLLWKDNSIYKFTLTIICCIEYVI